MSVDNFENYILLPQYVSNRNQISSDEKNTKRKRILLDYDWQFKMEGEENWKIIDIPHDFSIIQKFSENQEAQVGFLPGGKAYYKKTFVLPKLQNKFSAVLYFYGIYKNSYISLNGTQLGENHYGYNSFSFDISEKVITDGKKENILEIRVEHEQPSSRWYSGSGIFRSVELIITNGVHVAIDGLKITTPDIEKGKGTVKIETEIRNDLKSMSQVKLNLTIKDKEKKKVTFISTAEKIIKGECKEFITSVLNVEKPEFWSDTSPTLYILEVEVIANGEIVDNYVSRFGFRYYHFNKEKGFIINGIPTKLHGVSNHHDYGALGSIDNYDAGYKRFTQLKEMGINSIRTTHNTAHKTWIEICDELGIFVIEEMFDGWNYCKNQDSKDFSEYFNVPIKGNNNINDGKEGMTWAEYVVKSTVKRDRNSPSIIMWSIGNEINCNSKIDENTPNLTKNLILWGKELDDTRPFTSGENDCFRSKDIIKLAVNEEIQKSGGVVGYNYAKHWELKDGVDKYGSIYLSESSSALNSRSVYSNIENGGLKSIHDGKLHLTSYDVSFPSWASTAHYSLWITLSQDFVAGQYVWTGHDYIGEPTPWNGFTPGSISKQGPIPNSAYFGIIDSAGFPKDTYYLYRSQLRKDSLTLHIVSAWDKNNICYIEGNKTPVHVYTNVPKAELYRDDKSEPLCTLTRKKEKTNAGYIYYSYTVSSNDPICQVIDPSDEDLGTNLFARFNIEFKEGTKLYSKSYDEEGKIIQNDKIVGKQLVGAPNLNNLEFEVSIDKNILKADAKSLAYIEISVVDNTGILNTKAENIFSINLEGEGKILGVDNGDQATVDKYQQKSVLKNCNYAQIKAYAGKALIIISSTRNKGSIKLIISSEGFPKKTLEVKTEL